MKTSDIFIKATASKINEAIEQTFGQKLKLENYSLDQLEDARNRLRTQIHQYKQSSNFNETIENESYIKSQWMLDAVNAEIAQREEVAVTVDESTVEEIENIEVQGEEMDTTEAYINNVNDAVNVLAALRKQSKMASRGEAEPVRPNQLINDLWDVITWIEANMKESVETIEDTQGKDMNTQVKESATDKAGAVVAAKTMVDRVSRWIEELAGMENDQLLDLGDTIRDEMGQEQAKAFLSSVAPAIQQALETLKQTRETLSSGVRSLTGEAQPEEMLGADPAAADGAAPAGFGEPEAGADDIGGEVEPDELNAAPEDDFTASEPAIGGAEEAGRAKRESIERSHSLLKVLAG
jgi:hypothetical protein